MDFYENLARENSNDPAFEAGRGKNYWWLAVARSGMDSVEKKEQALSDAKKMRAILLRDLNRIEEAEQACNEAIDILKEAIERFPSHTGCSVKLGACYMQRGRRAIGRCAECVPTRN